MKNFDMCPHRTLFVLHTESYVRPLVAYLLISWYACSEGVTDRRRAQANNILLYTSTSFALTVFLLSNIPSRTLKHSKSS